MSQEALLLTGGFLLLVAAVIYVALDRLSLNFLRPLRRKISTTPSDLGLSSEEITVDGDVKLRMWLARPLGSDVPALEEVRSVVLLVHGWGANSSGPLSLAPALVEQGHLVAMVDVRGHGRSDAGHFVTMRHFRDDVAVTVTALRRRYPNARVSLVGHSMGGAAGLLASADGAEIERLVMIAAPFDIYDATHRFLVRKKMPARLMLTTLRHFWRRRVGVPYPTIFPGLRAPDVKVPSLVIQPTNDNQVPLADGTRLAEAMGTEAMIVEGAGHSEVLKRPEVHSRIADFIGRQVPIDHTA